MTVPSPVTLAFDSSALVAAVSEHAPHAPHTSPAPPPFDFSTPATHALVAAGNGFNNIVGVLTQASLDEAIRQIRRRWAAQASSLTPAITTLAVAVMQGTPLPAGTSSSPVDRGAYEDSYAVVELFRPTLLVSTRPELLGGSIDQVPVVSPGQLVRQLAKA